MKFLTFILAIIAVSSIGTARAADLTASETIGYGKTQVIALSSCPPYRPDLAGVCATVVNRFTEVMRDTLKIPPENITALVGEDTSYANFTKVLADKQAKTTKDMRTIFFLNVHGMIDHMEADSSGIQDHELIALWTPEKPFAVQAAIAQKQWMLSSDLRDIIDTFEGEKIIIIDSCHAGAAEADLKHHPIAKDIDNNEAVIVSAGAEEYAHLTADQGMALFTARLADVIEGGSADWGHALRISRKLTEKESYEICKVTPECSQIPKELWTQTPRIYDPEGLLEKMPIVAN